MPSCSPVIATFSGMILFWIRIYNRFEVYGVPYRSCHSVLPFIVSLFWPDHSNRQQVRSPCTIIQNTNPVCSLERIQQYIEIEQEPKSTSEREPPAYWPASGELNVENLSARYSPDGPKVLHDISFKIKSGERVGVGE